MLEKETEVLLIVSPFWDITQPSLGVYYIAAYLQSRGISIDVFDINAEAERRTRRQGSDEQETTNKKEKNNIYSQKQVPYQVIVDLFNEMLPELPSVKVITDTRKKHLKARWHSSDKTQTPDWWKEFFVYIRESDFLMGRKADFRASFDWIINSTNFVKIIEGNYHK